MTSDVDATLQPRGTRDAGRTCCCAIACRSGRAEHRVPARVRLEQAIGPELARRLVTSLTARSRRRNPRP